MATRLIGTRTRSLTRDSEGNREYTVHYLVESALTDDIADVLETPGLPVVGSAWDGDPWAHCTWASNVKPHETIPEGSPVNEWVVEVVFSTKPFDKSCKDEQITNPLLEPVKASGSFTKHTTEATSDRFSQPILNTAHEVMRGPAVEFDDGRASIKLEFNVGTFSYVVLAASLVDCVNDDYLWGVPPRCLKLSGMSWQRQFFGFCYVFYSITLDFEINLDTFDRDVVSEGGKVLHGEWTSQRHWRLKAINSESPDPSNPAHFDRAQDPKGDPMRLILSDIGTPAGVCLDDPAGTLPARLVPAPTYFVSIIGPNLDYSPKDGEQWVEIDSLTPDPWEDEAFFARGSVVTYLGNEYVAVQGSFGIAPTDDPSSWVNIGALNSVGEWNRTTPYALGDYVTGNVQQGSGSGSGSGAGDCVKSEQGTVHIEYYPEVSFLVLGLPLYF